MNDKHLAVTEQLIAQLEQGCAPWVRPWSGASLPSNFATGHVYRGINILWLWMTQITAGYTHANWLTFRQALSLGGNVRKGERGTPIFFYKTLEVDDERAKDGVRAIPMLKSYTVFNVAQCDGITIEEEAPKEPFACIADAEAFLAQIGAIIKHGGGEAYYMPSRDEIHLPEREQFLAPEHYYSTALHECAHWSGAKHRLARDLSGRFGSHAYAAEELIAEMTSAYLCAELGIPGQLRHAEYLANWIQVLRGDPKALFTAGARASEAADYLARLAGRRDAAETLDEAA